MQRRAAFTIVELLVVISIIVLLIALLLPALNLARTNAQRAICLSNMRQQHEAQTGYATDNNGRFAPRNENSPDYQRQQGAQLNTVHAMRDDYIGNTDVMVCPLVAKVSSQPLREYQRHDWLSGSGAYGGWDTNAAYVYTAYMWMAGFNGGPGGTVTYLNGEPPAPTAMTDTASDTTFITHRLNYYNANSLHEVSHGGRGLFQTATPYDDWQTTDQPITFADGHSVVRSEDDIEPRMVINGNYPASPGFPGTYLW